MKINREDIKELRITEYAEYIFEQPYKIYNDIMELAQLREVEKRHALAKWNFHTFYISDKYKSDGFLEHYKVYGELFEKWHASFKAKVKPLEEQSTEAFTTLATAGVYPFKECRMLGEWELIDLLDSCDINKWAKFAEVFYNGALTVFKENLDRKKSFDNKAEIREIERLENKDFDFVDCMVDGLSCVGILNKGAEVAMKLADTLAELTFYKELVNGRDIAGQKGDNNKFTTLDKLKMLKSIGMFELDFFSINPLNENANSKREQARFLSKILETNETNIRNWLDKLR